MAVKIVFGRYKETNQKAIIMDDVELTIEDTEYEPCRHELIVRPEANVDYVSHFAVETGADTGNFYIWNIKPWVLNKYAEIDEAIQAKQTVGDKPELKYCSTKSWHCRRTTDQ